MTKTLTAALAALTLTTAALAIPGEAAAKGGGKGGGKQHFHHYRHHHGHWWGGVQGGSCGYWVRTGRGWIFVVCDDDDD